MNKEEVINNLKKYISFSEKECNFPSTWDWNWHMELANDIETLLTAYEKEKEKNKKIDEFCRKELAFERRLKRENREPDEFNQGRFYVSENIRKIIEGNKTMLSDEEKQAIETVKGITENDLLNYWEGPEEPYDAIQIVLNLITKQSKEIEELRKKNEPQPDCAESIERTEEMVNMKWVNYNYISKDKIKELREIDNIDLIQFKIKELLGE